MIFSPSVLPDIISVVNIYQESVVLIIFSINIYQRINTTNSYRSYDKYSLQLGQKQRLKSPACCEHIQRRLISDNFSAVVCRSWS